LLDYKTIINVLTEKVKELETTIYVKNYTIEDLTKKLEEMEQNKAV
jgi:hypothetical protein